MSFADMPRIPKRKWHRMSSSLVSLERAQAQALWLKNHPGTTAVKIVKETRWRVFWKMTEAGA